MHQVQDIDAERPVIAPKHVIRPQMDLEVNIENFSSITLARLADEVRNEHLPGATKYDRTYNRHNR